VIGTTSSSKIQQLASTALVEVAESISGKEGCAEPSGKDIVVLLDALMLPNVTSRDSALQVKFCDILHTFMCCKAGQMMSSDWYLSSCMQVQYLAILSNYFVRIF
jgi:hypothetical protein